MYFTLPQIDVLEKTAIGLIPKPKPAKGDPAVAKVSVNSKRARRALGLAKAHFSAEHTKGLRHLIAILTDQDPESLAPESEYRYNDMAAQKGQAIIITKEHAGHGYKLNRPAFFRGDDNGVCWQAQDDGKMTTGNHGPSYHDDKDARAAWRFATADEIKAECARLREIAVKKEVELPW